jgi:hypothetical protein
METIRKGTRRMGLRNKGGEKGKWWWWGEEGW